MEVFLLSEPDTSTCMTRGPSTSQRSLFWRAGHVDRHVRATSGGRGMSIVERLGKDGGWLAWMVQSPRC
eukprot:338282-Chlamydomonas_euryale.AAC.1